MTRKTTSFIFQIVGLLLLSLGISFGVYKLAGWSVVHYFGDGNQFIRSTNYWPIVVHLWGALVTFMLLSWFNGRGYPLAYLGLRAAGEMLRSCFLSQNGAHEPSALDGKSDTKNNPSMLQQSSWVERFLLLFGAFSGIWLLVHLFGGGLHHYSIAVGLFLPFCVAWVLRFPGFRNFHRMNLKGAIACSNWETVLLVAMSLMLVGLYFMVNRPDADDGTYLRISLFGLTHPTHELSQHTISAMLKTDHAERLISSYNLFRTIPSYVFGIPLLLSYFSVVPPLLVAALPFLLSVFFRELFNLQKHWCLIAIALTLALLIIWGDAHRTPANFGIVRAFQGKSIYVTLIVPLQILCFIRLFRSANVRNTIEATLAASAGVFCTMNGLIVGAWLLLLLVLLPSVLQRQWRTLAFVLPVVVYFGTIFLIASENMLQRLKPEFLRLPIISAGSAFLPGKVTPPFGYRSVSTLATPCKSLLYSRNPVGQGLLPNLDAVGPQSDRFELARQRKDEAFHLDLVALAKKSNLEVIQYAYGGTTRTYLILLSTLLIFFTGADPGIKRLVLLMGLLLLVPNLLGSLGAATNPTLSWRLLWALPFTLIVPGSLVWLLARIASRTGKHYGWFILFAWISMVMLPGKTVFRHDNGTEGTWLGFYPVKLEPGKPLPRGRAHVEIEGVWMVYDGIRY